MTPESKVKAKIKAILKAHNVYYVMPIGTGYGNSGVPDFLCCVNGKFLGIEAKAGKGKTTALQEKNLRQIQESGGLVMVVDEDSIEEVQIILDYLSRNHGENFND